MTNSQPKPADSLALKFDDGKPRIDLFPPEALIAVSQVLSFGATKYGSHNWRRGMAWSRLFAATQRHLWAWCGGEDTDHESGLSHLAHAATCLSFLLAYEAQHIGTDDRWRTVP